MKEKTIFIGIDVSKASLDLCLLQANESSAYQIPNRSKSIHALFKRIIKKNSGARIAVCMENTGYYNWPCYEVFEQLDIKVYVVNALHLKRSLGMVRGKNDSIDARRIAKFLALHFTQIQPTLIARKEIRQVQALLAQRARLIEIRTKLSVPANELSFITDKRFADQVRKSSLKTLKTIEEQIKEIEKAIDKLISLDQTLNELYKYMVSVQGVGKVLAWTMLVKTNEFKSINNPKKLACYAGVVPFEFQSGSSIYKKPRVSYMADKLLKKLLHLSAMRAIQLEGELKEYYNRKIREGKNKMLVLNAIRNKIVARICAMVNNKRIYQIKLQLS